MAYKILKFFGPDLTEKEIKKFGILAIAFFFAIGSYWLLKTLKDGFFFSVVGGIYQPRAKMISLIAISILVVVYSKLIDIFHRHQLFYVLGAFYTVFFGLVSLLIALPTLTSYSLSPWVFKALGWITYVLIESFGSIMSALFWSFFASVTDTDTAKRGLFLVVASGQLGAIVGPFLAWNARTIGLPALFAIAALCIIFLMLVIKYFVNVMPREELIGGKQDVRKKDSPGTGFWEGLKLILTRPYLLGIFLIVSIYEMVTTIVDYQMKMQAQALPHYATKESLTAFMGTFGMLTNSLAFLMAIFGTGYLMKKFGLRFCLLSFPITLGLAISGLYLVVVSGSFSAEALLWTTVAVMVVAKGLSYALNNPAKELMYIPTSRDAKFKSKGWIDMFGARGAKAAGSGFNEFLKVSPIILLSYGTIMSLGLIGIWVVVAILVSGAFRKLVKEGKIVK